MKDSWDKLSFIEERETDRDRDRERQRESFPRLLDKIKVSI